MDPVAGNPNLIRHPMLKLECTIELSISRILAFTSDSSAYVHSEDDSNTPIMESAIPSESEEPDPDVSELEVSDDDEFLDEPGVKRKRAAKEKQRVNDEPVKVGSKNGRESMTRNY